MENHAVRGTIDPIKSAPCILGHARPILSPFSFFSMFFCIFWDMSLKLMVGRFGCIHPESGQLETEFPQAPKRALGIAPPAIRDSSGENNGSERHLDSRVGVLPTSAIGHMFSGAECPIAGG